MLQDFRDNIRGFTATILVAIIIIPFAFWGVESLFVSGSAVDQVATVNGDKITELEVLRGIEMQKQQILERFTDIDPLTVDDQLLRAPVLDFLIRQRLLVATARDAGMVVPDQTFTDIIVNSENFQQGGRFDPAFYEYQLSRMGYTPRDYQALVKSEMLANQLNVGIQASGLITAHQVDAFGRLALQQRTYTYVRLAGDDAGEVAVSDAEIAAYYDSHGDDFVEPDKVILDYIELSPAVLAAAVAVDEDQVAARIESQQQSAAEAVTTWRLAHILIEEGDDKLAEVQSRLAAGEAFADLAGEYSTDFGSAGLGGDLGTFTADALPEGFAEAIAELEPGAVSEPVVSESGIHLIKVVDRSESAAASAELNPQQVAEELRRELAMDAMPAMLDRLKDETYSVDSLAAAAEVLDLPLGVSEAFTRVGGEGIAAHPQVIAAAFSEDVLEHGYASEVIELGADRYLVIKLKELIPSHRPALEAVKASIAATLGEQKRQRQLVALAEQVLARLRAGETLDAIAAEASLQVETVTGALRFDQRLNPELGSAVFRHPTTASLPVHDMVAGGDEVYVYTLSEIGEGGAQALSQEERKAMQLSLAQLNGQREYLAYLETLVASAEIKRRK